jgi:hypothetical protein
MLLATCDLLSKFQNCNKSIISRAEEHTKMRPTGTHLGLDKYGFKLTWVGMPGMSWINIVTIVFRSMIFVEK